VADCWRPHRLNSQRLTAIVAKAISWPLDPSPENLQGARAGKPELEPIWTKSFVATCLSDPSGAAILTAIITMVHSIGITTTAEGVETEDQRLFLLQQGCDPTCDEVQGYLMRGVMSDGAIASFLARQADGGVGAVPYLSGHG